LATNRNTHSRKDSGKSARIRWLNLAFVLVFLGCSTNTIIRPGQDLYLDGPAVLITKDGKNLNVQQTRVRDDSISAVDTRTSQNVRMPVPEARKIVVKKRLKGALQGMLLFAGAGALLGMIPDPGCGDPCLFPNGGLEGSVFTAVLAAPAGALLGAILGSNMIYHFERTVPVLDSILNENGNPSRNSP
jgi:hypothetical protein